ncbi:beta-lactamase, partial [Kouleothrix aurantiaca]
MSIEPVARYETSGGARIYRIAAQVFPMLTGNVYLVLDGDYAALIDTGSGLGDSTLHVRQGFEQVRAREGGD